MQPLKKQPDKSNHDKGEHGRVLVTRFDLANKRLERTVEAGRFVGKSSIALEGALSVSDGDFLAKRWALEELNGAVAEPDNLLGAVRIVDLFCGAGGFSAGIAAAARALGIQPIFESAIDLDLSALQTYSANLQPRRVVRENVDSLIDYSIRFNGDVPRFGYPPELLDPSLDGLAGNVDIVIGGPPCQGHSNFNNHTRGADPRNALYYTVPAVGLALDASAIIIENVQNVVSGRSRLVETTEMLLAGRGYKVENGVLEADRFGVPQKRKRHFLIATKDARAVTLDSLSESLSAAALTAFDAIGDLEDIEPTGLFDMSATLSQENRDRVNYLFENDLYNLPNEERPDCHKDGHTYPSVYGRIYPDRPAQTITGGFLSPGRGRFTHPTRPRGLTPHEAARLQGFPDSFRFERSNGDSMSNKDFAKQIGDAVPPPLGYALGLAALSSL